MASPKSQKSVLIICGDYMEDYEIMVPFQALQAYGFSVDAACPGKKVGDICRTAVHQGCGHQTYSESRGHNFTLNATFDEIDANKYDGLIIPGGRAPEYLAMNDSVLDIVTKIFTAGKPVASICHGQLILAAADLVKGRKCTAYPPVKPVLVAAGSHWVEPATMAECVIDGNLITGATYEGHPEFIRLFVKALGGTITGSNKRILFLCGDYMEDYEVMVPFQSLEATKGPATKTDKPSRRRKKASDGAGPINKEPSKKKFCHSTRKNRRTVSKELLETAEEDIDHSKLRMKDLIILAEIKERRSNKEAEALKKSFPYRSADNPTPNDAPYDDEDPLASTEGLNPEDDRANLKYESSCRKLNYHSFMNRTPTERWSKSDTEMFYEAIRQFGADFAMIQQLFPGRTRHQVKLKFKAEERKHPLQVNDALSHRSKDLSHFALVIERLQEAQAEQNANRDADFPDVPSENEEVGAESEPKGEEVAKEELEAHSPVKSNASQDYFDGSQYGTADEPYLQDMEEFEYVSF